MAAYIQLMNAPDRPEFGATIRKATSYAEQAYLLGAANPVWASARYELPDGAPGSEIISVINTYGLTKYDGPAPPPPPTPEPSTKEYEVMDSVALPDGTIVSHAVTPAGHYLEITAPRASRANRPTPGSRSSTSRRPSRSFQSLLNRSDRRGGRLANTRGDSRPP